MKLAPGLQQPWILSENKKNLRLIFPNFPTITISALVYAVLPVPFCNSAIPS